MPKEPKPQTPGKKPKYLQKALAAIDPLAIAPQLPDPSSHRPNPRKNFKLARLIDLEAYTQNPDTVTVTMPNVIVTVLSEHCPETLDAFLAFHAFPDFTFRGQRKVCTAPRLAIIRGWNVEGKIEVKCGYRYENFRQTIALNAGGWQQLFSLEVNADGVLVPVKFLAEDGQEMTAKMDLRDHGMELGWRMMRDLVEGEIFVDTGAEVRCEAVEMQ